MYLSQNEGQNDLNKNNYVNADHLYYYKMIADYSEDLISIFTLNGICVFISPSCRKILGYEQSEMIGKNIFDYLHPDEIERIKKYQRNSLKFDKSNSFEHRIKRKDGTYIWLESNGTLFLNEIDNKKEFIIISRNISERKAKEEELLKLSYAVGQSPSSVMITDTDGNLEYVNSTFELITGYSASEAIGKNPKFLQSGKTTPETYKDLWNNIKAGNTWRGELLNKRKSGELFWESATISPIKDKLNNTTHYLGIKLDITQKKKSIELLKQSERKFRQIWENSADGMRLSDKSGTIVAVNDAYCRMVELEKEKLEGHDVTVAYLSGTSDDLPLQIAEQFNDNSTKRKFQTERVLWNGKKVFYDVTTAVVNISGGKNYVLSIIRDNTELRVIEQSLRLNENRLKQALEATRAGMWDWNMLTQEVYYSPNLLKLLGYDPDEQMDTEKFWQRTTHPDDLYDILKKVDDHLKQKEEFYENKFRKIRKNGDIIWVLDRGRVIEWDKYGNPVRMTGTMIDITKNKLDEFALLRSEEKFKSLFNSAGDSIFLVDFSGNIIEVNDIACSLLGLEQNKIVGKNLTEFLNNNHRFLDVRRLNELTKFGQTIFEEKLQPNYGNKIDIEISAKLIQYLDEKAVLCIGRDITDRKIVEEETLRAKEKAEEMNRLKTNFLANMSHELRTPLVGILGFADLLNSELENSDHKEMSETILKSGERLLSTLSNILNLSKIESGKTEVVLKKTNVHAILKSTAHLFSAAAKFKGIEIEYQLLPGELYLEVDENLISEVFNNLINNAIKFTDSGKITLRTRVIPEDSNKISIEVSDTGIGISQEHIGYIFEEFRQISEGFSRSFEGTGLGLTITKKFVELMNGTIRVDSEINKGTTFILEFPDYNKFGKSGSNELTTIFSTKKRTLVVEDDEISKKFITACIQDFCDIDLANDGHHAIKLASENNYDLVLMDINLGRSIDGLDTTKEIRKMQNYKETPIVAVTAYAREEDKQEFLKGGCSHYLSKPYTRNDIRQLLDRIYVDINK